MTSGVSLSLSSLHSPYRRRRGAEDGGRRDDDTAVCETRERETEGKRPAVRPPFVSHGRSLAHASLAPSVVPLRRPPAGMSGVGKAAVSDMSRRPTDPPIPPPTPWLAPRHLPPPSVTPVRHSLVLRLAHSDMSCRRRRAIER